MIYTNNDAECFQDQCRKMHVIRWNAGETDLGHEKFYCDLKTLKLGICAHACGGGGGGACVRGVSGFDAGTNANTNKKVTCWSKFPMRTLLVSLSSWSQQMSHGFPEYIYIHIHTHTHTHTHIWQSMQKHDRSPQPTKIQAPLCWQGDGHPSGTKIASW